MVVSRMRYGVGLVLGVSLVGLLVSLAPERSVQAGERPVAQDTRPRTPSPLAGMIRADGKVLEGVAVSARMVTHHHHDHSIH